MDAMYDTVFGVLVGECLVEELQKLVEEGFELRLKGPPDVPDIFLPDTDIFRNRT